MPLVSRLPGLGECFVFVVAGEITQKSDAEDRTAHDGHARKPREGCASPGLRSTLPRADYHGADPANTAIMNVSEREQTVLRWLAEGKTACEIAVILNISVCTVPAHMS